MAQDWDFEQWINVKMSTHRHENNFSHWYALLTFIDIAHSETVQIISIGYWAQLQFFLCGFSVQLCRKLCPVLYCPSSEPVMRACPVRFKEGQLQAETSNKLQENSLRWRLIWLHYIAISFLEIWQGCRMLGNQHHLATSTILQLCSMLIIKNWML